MNLIHQDLFLFLTFHYMIDIWTWPFYFWFWINDYIYALFSSLAISGVKLNIMERRWEVCLFVRDTRITWNELYKFRHKSIKNSNHTFWEIYFYNWNKDPITWTTISLHSEQTVSNDPSSRSLSRSLAANGFQLIRRAL